ncbi:6,7-dimethyl-8-ribityllumazine synthase [Thermoleophilia bacterium SCSIO 60948]|nr:6,7-dimethyl-8-ribityllumazine synthase [Thermoleophilia bacterium SCSIO 60948]
MSAAADESFDERVFALCVANFYPDLAERLVNSATEAFLDGGVAPSSLVTYEVPGAFELPTAAKWCAETGRFDGVACLGAVIRGETSHYDHVCDEAARGIGAVARETGVPVAFGLLTCETREQAEERAGGGKRDQGRNAAVTLLRMSELRAELGRR